MQMCDDCKAAETTRLRSRIAEEFEEFEREKIKIVEKAIEGVFGWL